MIFTRFFYTLTPQHFFFDSFWWILTPNKDRTKHSMKVEMNKKMKMKHKSIREKKPFWKFFCRILDICLPKKEQRKGKERLKIKLDQFFEVMRWAHGFCIGFACLLIANEILQTTQWTWLRISVYIVYEYVCRHHRFICVDILAQSRAVLVVGSFFFAPKNASSRKVHFILKDGRGIVGFIFTFFVSFSAACSFHFSSE